MQTNKDPAATPGFCRLYLFDSYRPLQSFSQQNQQLDLVGGCNAIIPQDLVVRGSCSIPPLPKPLIANTLGFGPMVNRYR
jgi:hypothetical protein